MHEWVHMADLWRIVCEPAEKENLFWVMLDHSEGEFRIGLGHISFDDEEGSIAMSGGRTLEVIWYERTSKVKHERLGRAATVPVRQRGH